MYQPPVRSLPRTGIHSRPRKGLACEQRENLICDIALAFPSDPVPQTTSAGAGEQFGLHNPTLHIRTYPCFKSAIGLVRRYPTPINIVPRLDTRCPAGSQATLRARYPTLHDSTHLQSNSNQLYFHCGTLSLTFS